MRWIEEQVNSILTQEDVEVRLFISIDTSSDDMLEWYEELVAREARVVLLPDIGVFGGAAKTFSDSSGMLILRKLIAIQRLSSCWPRDEEKKYCGNEE